MLCLKLYLLELRFKIFINCIRILDIYETQHIVSFVEQGHWLGSPLLCVLTRCIQVRRRRHLWVRKSEELSFVNSGHLVLARIRTHADNKSPNYLEMRSQTSYYCQVFRFSRLSPHLKNRASRIFFWTFTKMYSMHPRFLPENLLTYLSGGGHC